MLVEVFLFISSENAIMQDSQLLSTTIVYQKIEILQVKYLFYY